MIPTLARFPLATTLLWLCGIWLHGAAWANGATRTPDICNGVRDLIVVAHMDDDLLFMNPDIDATLAAGGCVRTLYMTASERNDGAAYMRSRESGVRAAYARMADAPDNWFMQLETLAGHPFASFTLASNPRIQLWHMRLTDPWLGKGWGSLTPLSQAESVPGQSVATLALPPSIYTRQGLVDTLATMIREYAPTVIRHMDDSVPIPYAKLCWRCSGHDHPDHISSARLTREATLLAPGAYARIGYVNYPSQERPANLSAHETARKTDIFRRYAWQDNRYCPAGRDCNSPAGPTAAWVARTYYVSMPDSAPALIPGADNSLQLLGTDKHGNTPAIWQSGSGQWRAMGGRSIVHPGVILHPDDSASILALDAQGQLWQHDLASTRGPASWQRFAGFARSHFPAITREGPPALAALDHQGRMRWAEADASTHVWRAAAALPRLANIRPEMALARDQAGRLVVFVLDLAGKLFYLRQTAPGSHAWQQWQALDAPASSGGLAVLRNAQGGLELYFRDQASQHLLRLAQSPHGQWLSTEDLGVPYTGSPAVAQDAQGVSTVAVRSPDRNTLWAISAGTAHRFNDPVASAPALLQRPDGLYMAARLADAEPHYQIWVKRGQEWTRMERTARLPEWRGTPFSSHAEPKQDAPFQTHLMLEKARSFKH